MKQKAVQTVLGISESIIQALDDESIYTRYSKIKNKIMEDYANVSTPELRKLIVENQDLAKRIDQIKSEYSQDNFMHEWIFSQFEILQAKIIPKAPRASFGTFEEASKSLLEVVDTKIMSHQFLKQKLSKENEQLKQAIQTMRNDSLSKIDAIKKKRIDMGSEWHKKEELMKIHLDEIKGQIEEHQKNMPTDTEKLLVQLNSITIDTTHQAQIEKKFNEVESQRNKLRSQIKKLQFAIQKVETEIEGLKQIQAMMEEGP
ncbi:hypothetical protein TRFO_02256 [Tritrichomonas foetus]|uniref:Uncharacterized protein n=1 Tax=Tritrichomonas foetus TaxID=1144522 RepID=A0A1J4J7T2_9EUKA|nr:hypothetical protein TRFO_02256 [Tritrichomonas foetus]|eukprot:OHS95266.1 hypothetical protein TRFO_02256 [Tritrichomonas foetus]